MTNAPQTIGRYEVIELLGRGAMAEVYRARDPLLGREVAIKLILPALAEDDSFERRFSTEARAIAGMRHPHIVQVYDFGIAEPGPYMVMEYIAGRTLKDRFKTAAGPLSHEDSVRILTAVSSALDYAHGKGVIHRDVKPTNILFREDGEPVLADFGIARVLDATQLTASAALTGTPAYIAPEQAAGKPVPQSDQYSLACVGYELLTGRTPFNASSLTEMVVKHMQEPPPALQLLRADLPSALNDVLQRGLAKRPEDRFATTSAFATEFERALRNTASATPTTAHQAPATAQTTASPQPVKPGPAATDNKALSGLKSAAQVFGALVGRRLDTEPAEQGRMGQWITMLGALGVILTALQFIVQSLGTLSGLAAQLTRSLSVVAALALGTVIVIGARVALVSTHYRRRAVAATAVCAAVGLAWISWLVYERYLRTPIGPVILVSEFQPCKTCGDSTIDDDIYIELRQVARQLNFPIEVRRVNNSFADSDAARAEGESSRAMVVIWGNYDATVVSPRFELLGLSQNNARLFGGDDLRSFAYALGADRKLEPVAYLSLGLLRYARHEYAEALPLFTKAVDALGGAQLSDNAAAAYFYRGMTRLYTGEPINEIVADLERARELDGSIIAVRHNLAAAYFSACDANGRNRLEDALREIEIVRKANQTSAAPFEIRGGILAAQRRWLDAAESYEAALSRENPDPGTLQSLVEAYNKAGKPEEAERVLAAYAALPTQNNDAVAVLQRTGKPAQAAAALDQRIANMRAQNADSTVLARMYSQLGLIHFGANDYARARDAFLESIRLAPKAFGLRSRDATSPYAMLARAYDALNERTLAAEQYQRALELSPCDDGAWSGLAMLQEKQEQFDVALASYRKALNANPTMPEYAISIARLSAQLNYPINETRAAYADAARRYESLVLTEPTQAVSWFALGTARREAGLPGAETAYDRAAELDPVNFAKPQSLAPMQADDLLLGSMTAAENHNLPAAIDLARQAVSLAPRYERARWMLGHWLNQAGQHETALVELQAAIEISPAMSVAWADVGSANLRLKRYEDAAGAYRRVTEIDPQNSGAWQQLANLLVSLNRPAEALPYARRAVSIQPADALAYGSLGGALSAGGQYTEAVQAFEQSLALSPTNSLATQQLAYAHYQLAQYGKAAEAFGRAVALAPDNAELVGTHAFLLVEAGKIDEGFAAAQRAAALTSGRPSPWVDYALGAGYRARGETTNAKAALERVLNSEQADAQLKEKARTLIDSL